MASFPELNPNPVLEVDQKGRVHYANPAARHIAEKLGLTEGVKAFLPPDLKELFAKASQGGPREYSFDLTVKDAVYAVTLSFPHDLPTARLYALDITERKRAEEALRRAHDELDQRVQERTAALRLANEQLHLGDRRTPAGRGQTPGQRGPLQRLHGAPARPGRDALR